MPPYFAGGRWILSGIRRNFHWGRARLKWRVWNGRFSGLSGAGRVGSVGDMTRLFLSALVLPLLPLFMMAWDYEGHRVLSQIGLTVLPTNFPAFVHAPMARERIAFLGGEPDRWRNTADTALRHVNGPDHFLDLEDLAPLGLKPETLPPLRYDYVAEVARHHAKASPEKKEDGAGAVGFLPWSITEWHARLKSSFGSLKVYEELGTEEEVANARQNVLYAMGVLGHFVGDASQPLHTTRHFNGWVGANPKSYTTSKKFHAWIDGGYMRKSGGLDSERMKKQLRAARALPLDAVGRKEGRVFTESVRFLVEQWQQVEPLYRLEKEGKLTGEGEEGRGGRVLVEGQMVRGSQFLADLWLTAWMEAPPDNFLKARLVERKAGSKPAE